MILTYAKTKDGSIIPVYAENRIDIRQMTAIRMIILRYCPLRNK